MTDEPVLQLPTRSTPEPPVPPLEVAVAADGVTVGHAQLTWTFEEGPADPDLTLLITLPDGRTLTHTAWDLFECLFQIRLRQLDQEGLRLCCNGCRRNAWPSGMARAASGGLDTYIMRIGHGVTAKDVVQTFDPAPPEAIASAAEQQQYVQDWFRTPTVEMTAIERELPAMTNPSRQVIEAASWRLMAETIRRSPKGLVLLETHSGGGQYDCLRLCDAKTGQPFVDANRQGSIHVFIGDGFIWRSAWSEMVSMKDPREAAEILASHLNLSAALPPSMPATTTYRMMAAVVAATVFGRATVEWRSGFFDTSGPGGGQRVECFERFRSIEMQPSPWAWLDEPSYQYWFLLVEGKPVAAVQPTTGHVWDFDGTRTDVHSLYQTSRNIWPVLSAALPRALTRVIAGNPK